MCFVCLESNLEEITGWRKTKDTSVAAKLALVDSFELFIAINDPPGALSSQLAK